MGTKAYSRLFRQQFVEAWMRNEANSFIEHCSRYGVPRATAYEWLHRYEARGADGLEDVSSAPHSSPQAVDEEVVAMLVAARRHHPHWGPKKLKAWLEDSTPYELALPAPSTIGDILKRHGLVADKKRRRRPHRYASPYTEAEAPNDVWTADFKGQFRLGDRAYCYPLTLVDSFSRYIVCCDAYRSTSARCRRSFERTFEQHGLPLVIRSDNGTPFSSAQTVAGLSKLSVWWVRLGILPERITPASPWENGRHERMHRTLKHDATDPPQPNQRRQQRAFDVFRREYNEQRPHEALQMKPPATFYAASPRPYRSKLPELEYPPGHLLRRVSNIGVISCCGHRVFLTSVLAGEVVGLRERDAKWEVHFGPLLLGFVSKQQPETGLVPVPQDAGDL